MFRLAVLVLVGSLMAGCAGTGNKPFAPSVKLDTVAVLEVPQYQDYFINNMSATMVGVAASKAAYQGALRKKLADAGFDFRKEFTREVEAALKEVGLKAEIVAVSRTSPGLLASYEGIPTSAQAILDVAAVRGIGYATETPSGRTDYRPSMPGVKVVLVNRADGAVLYSETFKYGDKNRFIPGTQVEAPEGTYFATGEDLLAGDNAVRALRIAIKHQAEVIATALQQGNTQVVHRE